VYGFLSAEPLPSLAAQCEFGIHLVSIAKSTHAGLRIAYVNTNPEIAARLRYSIETLLLDDATSIRGTEDGLGNKGHGARVGNLETLGADGPTISRTRSGRSLCSL
jgi:hypothetical protein